MTLNNVVFKLICVFGEYLKLSHNFVSYDKLTIIVIQAHLDVKDFKNKCFNSLCERLFKINSCPYNLKIIFPMRSTVLCPGELIPFKVDGLRRIIWLKS